jgi:ADP-heptose:LPS heptosyltransferase
VNKGPNSVNRILIIKRGALGDLLAGTAGIGLLRREFKNAHICLLSDVLAFSICPPGTIVDEIINEKEYLKTKAGYINLLKLIRRRKFDLIVNMRWVSEISGVLTLMGASKYTAGAGSWWLRKLYSFAPPLSNEEANCHEYLLNIRIAAAVGLVASEPKLYLHQSPTDIEFAENFYKSASLDPSKTLIVTPIASTPLKAWPAERFVETAKKFIDQFDAHIAITFAPHDEHEAMAIKNAIGPNALLAPKTTVNQLASIISKAPLCLCNNSGIMHVAFAVNTPVVCINTSIGWAPYGDWNVAVTQLPKGEDHFNNRRLTNYQTQELLKQISVERVWKALAEMAFGG